MGGDVRCSFGIDLASNCEDWGVCRIDWPEAARPTILVYEEIRDRGDLLERLQEPCDGPVGIDAPFGWPKGFKDFVQNASEASLGDEADGIPLKISYRITDLVVSSLKSYRQGVARIHGDRLREKHRLEPDETFRFLGSSSPMSVERAS